MFSSTFIPVGLALEATDVIGSSGAVPTQWGDHTIINTQHGAVIDWSNFNTNATQSVTFNQSMGAVQSSASAVLNRVSSGSVPTVFNGALYSNGQVFVVNPAGIVFGAGSTVNVAQFVASGLNMSNDAFHAVVTDVGNPMIFEGGAGRVRNYGSIEAESVHLVGRKVLNAGSIVAPDGLVVMAAGDVAYLAQNGSGVWVEYYVNPMNPSTNVINSGTIETGDNGRIVLASGDAFSNVIHHAGLVAAAPWVGPKQPRMKNYQGYAGKSYHTMFSQAVTYCYPKPSHHPYKPYPGHPPKPTPCPKPDPPDPPNPPDPPDAPSPPDPPNPPDQPDPPDQPNPPDPPNPPDLPDTPGPEPKFIFPYFVAAPVPEKMELEYSGSPALVKWVAKELGIDEKSVIDIWTTNALASPRHIQPYEMYAKLRKDALILRDETGSYIAALARLIGGYASSAAPPTEEQMASIADAIANNTQTGNDYAITGQYLDALTEYVDILDRDVGFSADKAIEFVTTKYVDRLVQGDNVHVAAYISVRLASLKGRLVARDL